MTDFFSNPDLYKNTVFEFEPKDRHERAAFKIIARMASYGGVNAQQMAKMFGKGFADVEAKAIFALQMFGVRKLAELGVDPKIIEEYSESLSTAFVGPSSPVPERYKKAAPENG